MLVFDLDRRADVPLGVHAAANVIAGEATAGA